jgi:hypothetical protein
VAWFTRLWKRHPVYRRTFESSQATLLRWAAIGMLGSHALGYAPKALARHGIWFTPSTAGLTSMLLFFAAYSLSLYAIVRLHVRVRDAKATVKRHGDHVCPMCLYPCPDIQQQCPATCPECGGYLVHDEIISFWKHEFPKEAKRRDSFKEPTP